MRSENKKMRSLIRQVGGLDSDGKLPAYAWPGGYPLYYADGEDSILCPVCADKSRKDWTPSRRPVSVGVNYEDAYLYCDDCGNQIEVAYETEGTDGH